MKQLFFAILLALSANAVSQTASIQNFCVNPGSQATISGMKSSNYQQGVIPLCKVTVYLTGTETLATIYKDGINTPLSNPFTATVNGSWIFWAAIGQGYDVALSGGIPPNVYLTPFTLTSLFPGGSSGASSRSGVVPTNANLVFTGISVNDDDPHVIEPTAIAISGYTCASSVCMVTTLANHGFVVGQWISMRAAPDFAPFNAAMPTYEGLGTGYTLFQLASVPSSTRFTFAYTAASPICSSSCGSAYDASYNYPYAVWRALGKVGNPIVALPSSVTIVGLATYYSSLFHSISPAVTGLPGYLIINNHINDVQLGTSASTIENAYTAIFETAHTDGWIVVIGSSNALSNGQVFQSSIYVNQIEVDNWLKEQGKTASTASTGNYWDLFVDVGAVLNDATDANLIASNNGFGPAGAYLAAARTAQVLYLNQSSPFTRMPLYWGMLASDTWLGTNAGGYMFAPAASSARTFLFTDPTMSVSWLTIKSSGISSALSLSAAGLVDTAVPASSGTSCLQIDTSGNITNTGQPCFVHIADTTVSVSAGSQGANSCSSTTNITMTGLTTSMVLLAGYSSNPVLATGWGSTGGMVFQIWPSAANTATWQICNQTGSSITYSGITFNVGAV